MLAGSFFALFYLKWFSSKLILKFPKLPCPPGEPDEMEALLMERQAIMSWKTNQKLEERGKYVSYDGKLQCFCDYQKSQGKFFFSTYG